MKFLLMKSRSVYNIYAIIFVILLVLIAANLEIYSQSDTTSILILKDTLSPLQRLLSDTTTPPPKEIIEKPGEAPRIKYLPEQDSAYFEALKLEISPKARFNNDLKMLASFQPSAKDSRTQVQRNMQVPAEYFLPSPVEVALHQYNIRKALSIPYINTMPALGSGIPFSTIGKLLGLEEDVSPTISYSIDKTSEVEIVVYSIQAVVIATIFKGYQTPGNYTYTWDGKNDYGQLMPPGDYILEVRIGNSEYIRKRTVIR